MGVPPAVEPCGTVPALIGGGGEGASAGTKGNGGLDWLAQAAQAEAAGEKNCGTQPSLWLH